MGDMLMKNIWVLFGLILISSQSDHVLKAISYTRLIFTIFKLLFSSSSNDPNLSTKKPLIHIYDEKGVNDIGS